MEQPKIRLATTNDAPAMLAIYAPLVRETAVTFEFEPPTIDEFRERIAQITSKYPWLVSELDGSINGFAYAGPHRSRPAYQWSAEVSVYVDSNFRRRGIAGALYSTLLKLLDDQGYQSAYAGITLPNDASEALHRALGFEPVGVYKTAGYKLGKWRDAVWYQRQIGDVLADPPSPPVSPELMHTQTWTQVRKPIS